MLPIDIPLCIYMLSRAKNQATYTINNIPSAKIHVITVMGSILKYMYLK